MSSPDWNTYSIFQLNKFLLLSFLVSLWFFQITIIVSVQLVSRGKRRNGAFFLLKSLFPVSNSSWLMKIFSAWIASNNEQKDIKNMTNFICVVTILKERLNDNYTPYKLKINKRYLSYLTTGLSSDLMQQVQLHQLISKMPTN